MKKKKMIIQLIIKKALILKSIWKILLQQIAPPLNQIDKIYILPGKKNFFRPTKNIKNSHIDINRKFKFKEETLYITIYIIDAYLSKKNFAKSKFQLLGVTSLFISSKLNEIILRRISDYSDVTDKTYSIQEIQIMEIEILKALNFELLVPSPLSFYEIITQKVGIVDDINKYKFGEFLIQSFLINNQSLNYTPSNIALAACYIVMKFCKMQNYKIIFDNKFFNDKSDYIKEYIIKDCAQKMCETIHIIINSNLKSTNNKFSDNFFYNIMKNNM